MSELINTNDNRSTIRWKLLTSASAMALIGYVASINIAKAADADRPLFWLDLGGQAEMMSGQGGVFAPPFIAQNPDSPVFGSVTPAQAQKPAKFSFGEGAKLSFQPEDSDWVFSAAIRYGRSSNTRHVAHQQPSIAYFDRYINGGPFPGAEPSHIAEFSKTNARRDESHAILDFTAGKDVGLGVFGTHASSTLSAGVRFAQFTSGQNFDIRARPDIGFLYYRFPSFHVSYKFAHFHTYHATGVAHRAFHGVGPTLSWNASVPFAGNAQDGEMAMDVGINGAILFGKQKARVAHMESSHYKHISKYYVPGYHRTGEGHEAAKSVTVPNIGGAIGVTFRKGDAKVSFGYRADLFLNAMDTGIDERNSSNVLFHGPYASISIGLGD